MERIVVGVDGSEESDRALVWALEEARLRGASVEVVHAWRIPMLAGLSRLPVVDYREVGQEILDAAVERALERVSGAAAETPITRTLVDGPIQRALCEAAQGAALLVVGSRGRGAFEELLLGSVSQYVAGHSSCPVVVAR